MGVTVILIGVTLHFFIAQVLPFNLGNLGKFYMINEGFFPKDIENEYAKVETCLEPLKENYLDKRIYGKFVIKKKLENMGLEANLYKWANQKWLKSGMNLSFPTICSRHISLNFLEESFTGKWDKKTCTLEEGTYFLRNYTMENDIKNKTSHFPFAYWNFTGILLADIEGTRVKVATASVLMHAKDEKYKNQEAKPAKNKKFPTCDKYK